MVCGGNVKVTITVLRVNWSVEGAVIRVREGGRVRIEGCEISGNVAEKSGGVM
jgi:hypothetical protein